MKTINISEIIYNYLITKWLPQSERAWLEAERERINKNPVRQAIIAENGKGKISLIENKPIRILDGGKIDFA